MVVGILLAVDLTIMTTWQVADPFYRAIKQMEPYVSTKLYKGLCIYVNKYAYKFQHSPLSSIIIRKVNSR